MSIKLTREKLVSLTNAAKTLPARRDGKKPHVSTVYRWSQKGCKGVVLETVQIGGTRCTSHEALSRFFERLTVITNPAAQRVISRERQEHAAEKASKELREEGC